MRSLDQRIAKVIKEKVAIARYDPDWPLMFEEEAQHLRETFPSSLIVRVEHFGSTAVPGLSAKPIVDMLVEVANLDAVKSQVVPVLEGKGYDYFWRPPHGDEAPPDEWYAWFIKRDASGNRTHHIHMVEGDSRLWERLLFRDYLREFPVDAERYSSLKMELSEQYPNDRVKYTECKSELIAELTEKARRYYSNS